MTNGSGGMFGNHDRGVSDVLNLEALLASAREKAGLDDFVDEGFIDPLSRLLAAYRAEADLPEQGLESMRLHLVDSLVTRLRIQDSVKRHPEILQEEIRGPLVVTGLSSRNVQAHQYCSSPMAMWRITCLHSNALTLRSRSCL